MATIVWKNAHMLIDGTALHTALHELQVDIGAEMLDSTVFGFNTRMNKGGLFTGSMSGTGFLDTVVGTEQVIFSRVGTGGSIVVVFPEGITEGSPESGFAMKGVVEQFDLGGAVGTMSNIQFAVQTEGIEVG